MAALNFSKLILNIRSLVNLFQNIKKISHYTPITSYITVTGSNTAGVTTENEPKQHHANIWANTTLL